MYIQCRFCTVQRVAKVWTGSMQNVPVRKELQKFSTLFIYHKILKTVNNNSRKRSCQNYKFLVGTSQQHKEILMQMGLENLCVEPYFSNLRNNMAALVEVLAAVAAGLPQHQYGFYRENCATTPPHPGAVSQEVARHCIIQARLLAYRTEDPKVGVGAVIWARGRSAGCRGTGCLDLVGCGYNGYPAGSEYAAYPQMDCTQEDRQRRKYRYIIHAEQNALTFRTRDVKPEELTMMFLTKCPCDECIPLIRGAGITHIYTSDQDRDKDKGDISYLRFSTLEDISKFVNIDMLRRLLLPPPGRELEHAEDKIRYVLLTWKI
uniref:Cytidine and dCMP deaminase domain-containing protein 1 n=1 Tax=Xiphophorus couchianus TaxID=32473 RepID=A0A3B5MUH7_9TELE